jgi:hypothetical protein
MNSPSGSALRFTRKEQEPEAKIGDRVLMTPPQGSLLRELVAFVRYFVVGTEVGPARASVSPSILK